MAMASMTIRDVPEGLRKQFRLLCVEQNESMNKRVIKLIAQEVEKAKSAKK